MLRILRKLPRALIHEFGHKYWDLMDDEKRSFFSKAFFDSKLKVEESSSFCLMLIRRHWIGINQKE